MSDNLDIPFDDRDEYIGEESLEAFINKLKRINKMNNKKYQMNKFYVGSNSVFNRDWGHSTLNKAIEHARELMNEKDMEEVFVVQIIRVIKREKSPIKIEVIK